MAYEMPQIDLEDEERIADLWSKDIILLEDGSVVVLPCKELLPNKDYNINMNNLELYMNYSNYGINNSIFTWGIITSFRLLLLYVCGYVLGIDES
jgi:hypothetical protein